MSNNCKNIEFVMVGLGMSYPSTGSIVTRLDFNPKNLFLFNGYNVTRCMRAYGPKNTIPFLKKIYGNLQLAYSSSGSSRNGWNFVRLPIFFFCYRPQAFGSAVFGMTPNLFFRKLFSTPNAIKKSFDGLSPALARVVRFLASANFVTIATFFALFRAKIRLSMFRYKFNSLFRELPATLRAHELFHNMGIVQRLSDKGGKPQP